MTSIRCSGNSPAKRGQMLQLGWKIRHSTACVCMSVDTGWGYWHLTIGAVIVEMIKALQQCYLQAARCLNSEQSWYYSRHCRYSLPRRGTESPDLIVWFIEIVSSKSVFYLHALALLTWIFMATSLPSFSLARCTWPMEAAANGLSSKYSSLSLQLGPRSLLIAFCGGRRSALIYALGLPTLCDYSSLSILYHHLFGGHEVSVLSNALKDLGQLRVNEGIILGERK